MEIREMAKGDVSEVFHLGRESFGSTAEYSWDWSPERVEQFLGSSGFGIVCVDKKDVVGFALVENDYAAQRPNVAWLNYIFVGKEHRRKEVGTKLFGAIFSRLKEANKTDLIVDVYEHNKESIDFFSSCGFEMKERWVTLSRKM